jgi:hypothetical protein
LVISLINAQKFVIKDLGKRVGPQKPSHYVIPSVGYIIISYLVFNYFNDIVADHMHQNLGQRGEGIVLW